MYTLGFRFKPWTSEKAIADGPSIMNYLKETVAENGIDKHIRYGQKVVAADWSDADNRWTVTRRARRRRESRSPARSCSPAAATTTTTRATRPSSPAAEDFEGTIVHPQHWPEDLDYTGKKIVVIGSGATAVTLIPALIDSGAGHVTMLQRSPTYIGSLPDIDPFAVRANKWLPEKPAYVVNRWKSITVPVGAVPDRQEASRSYFAQDRCAPWPSAGCRRATTSTSTSARATTRGISDVCARPTGDLFKTIRKGKADVVTDTIERFTKKGIQAELGRGARGRHHRHRNGFEPADCFGGADILRNGETVRSARSLMAYKGMMLTRHAQHGVHHRLHERVVDAEGRPGLRVRLPRAELHGRQRLRHRRAAAPRRYRRRTAADGLHTRLRPAVARPTAEVGARAARGGSSRTTSSTCA